MTSINKSVTQNTWQRTLVVLHGMSIFQNEKRNLPEEVCINVVQHGPRLSQDVPNDPRCAFLPKSYS